eukprot:CAMPEP_0194496606 /NCGR_PEP_ID=MMETSP0253-20130528/13819_1 /TAXON_ID=2966 /ORGANISM="Noctiluca scintillans" /LENGTH=377 /DNA_ID=CAMNT_0039338025 /DNA_START=56 /DNA_END=1189 /DNA_ORIENTATION=-
MGFIGGVCKLTAVLVLLVSLLIGSLFSDDTNVLKKIGLFRYLDSFDRHGRGQFFKGMFPAVHEGIPWGFQESEIPDLAGQTVLVTGGNVGLGYWSAYHLAAKKANVVIACRSAGKCETAAKELTEQTGTKVTTGLLDLSSFASIRAFAADFSNRHGALHSLILNAGVMATPFGLTTDGLEMQIGTNHFGHFLLTDLLLPLMENASASTPTVVVVSSAAHWDSYPEGIRWTVAEMNDEASYSRTQAYGQSKLANLLFAQELAERVKEKGILVNCIHPGGVDTELGRHFVDLVTKYLGEAASRFFAEHVMPKGGRGMWTPRDASLTQVFAAVSPTLKAKKVSGKYFHPIARETAPDTLAFNRSLQRHLWDITAAYVAEH